MLHFLKSFKGRKLFKKKDGKITKLLNLFFFIALIQIWLLMIFEKYSLIESIWQVYQSTTTIGYGNQPPETMVGRVISIIAGLIGIVILSNIFSAILDRIEERKRKRRLGLMKVSYKDKIALLNCDSPSRVYKFLRELRKSDDSREFVVINSHWKEIPPKLEGLCEFVKVIDTVYKSLKDSDIKKANRIILMTDAENEFQDELNSTLCRFLCEVEKVDDSKLLVLINDLSNKWMFNNVATTVVPTNSDIYITAQECLDKGLNTFFSDILSESSDNDIKITKLNNSPYNEGDRLNDSEVSNSKLILGVVRSNKFILNNKANNIELKKDDSLIVIKEA